MTFFILLQEFQLKPKIKTLLNLKKINGLKLMIQKKLIIMKVTL